MDLRETITPDVFLRYCKREFGTRNPTRFENPVYDLMIRCEYRPFSVRSTLNVESNYDHPGNPDFCFQRFGMTRTEMPDGRVIFIAGEHEDYYDPDFCIYNDVVVTRRYKSSRCDDEGYVEYDPECIDNTDAEIEYYAYPRSQFPPTDFHTATLVGKWIYLIGSLGYPEDRRIGATQVLRLNTETYEIKAVRTTGDNPGWLSRHRARLLDDGRTIAVVGGRVWCECEGEADLINQFDEYELDTETRAWKKVKCHDDWVVVNIQYDDQGYERLLDEEFASTSQGNRILLGLRDEDVLKELGYEVTTGEKMDYLTGESGGHTIHVDGIDVYCKESYECLKLVIQGKLPDKTQDRLINEMRSLLKSTMRVVQKVRIDRRAASSADDD